MACIAWPSMWQAISVLKERCQERSLQGGWIHWQLARPLMGPQLPGTYYI